MEASPEYFANGGYYGVGTPERKSAGSEHFVVDDLLDFSNEEEDEMLAAAGDDVVGIGNSAESSSNLAAFDSCSNSFSGDLMCRSFADASLSGDLCEPHDELAELEWLSNFAEESFSTDDLKKFHLINPLNSSASSPAAALGPSIFITEAASVPGKARSKRSRAAPGTWSSRMLVVAPSPAVTSSPEFDHIVLPTVTAAAPKKSPKKKEPSAGAGELFPAISTGDGRKCLHCQTDKTPQWRTGPMGPKTLCNACGVRYKSGRLVPEYRPAASPTFMLSKHSNSHRKVLELRRQKEMQQHQQRLLSAAANGGLGGLYEGSPAAAGDNFLIHHRLGPDFRQLI